MLGGGILRIPFNMIVYNDLLEKIKSNYYSHGDLLPTEQELEKIYGTSRAPIRQALGKLEIEGFIVRKSGKGTFVTKKGSWLGGFAKEFEEKWNQVRCETLSVQVIEADEEICNYLSLPSHEKVLYTKRIRFLNEKPINYLHHYLPDINFLDIIKSAGHFDTMRVLLQKGGIEWVYVSEELSAIKATQDIAEALMIEEGSPVLQIIRICFDEYFTPVEVVEYFVPTKNWRYRTTFRKDRIDAFI